MSILVVVLRLVPVLAFARSMLLSVNGHRRAVKVRTRPRGSDRGPLVANFVVISVYVPSLLLFSGSSAGSAALLLASSGAFLGLAGAAVVVRSRAELGPAWSLVPKADEGTGFVTSGPYRRVRHPIYFGLLLFALGEALAFGSWPAVMLVVFGIAPTFVYRARAEENLLGRTFGEPYVAYRQRTRMMIPYLF